MKRGFVHIVLLGFIIVALIAVAMPAYTAIISGITFDDPAVEFLMNLFPFLFGAIAIGGVLMLMRNPFGSPGGA